MLKYIKKVTNHKIISEKVNENSPKLNKILKKYNIMKLIFLTETHLKTFILSSEMKL